LSKFCTTQLSSIFYLSQEPFSCRVSFLKGTYNFQLFKNAFCKGACTLKCTEKRFIPFASLICPPHRIQGKPCGMYCTIHLLEIIRLSDFSSPLFYPSLLDLCTARNFSLPIFAHCKKSTVCLYVEATRTSSVHKCICRR
jgi:hypothetical protein